jgi:hypothetical protein
MVSDFREYAETCMAVATDSNGVLRKLPPSASCGAKPMEWTTPSRPPSSSPTRSDLGGLGKLLGDALGQRGTRERGQDDLRALLLGQLRGVEGDGGLHQHTGDQDALALENSAHGVQ